MATLALCVGWSFSTENDSLPSLDLLIASMDSTVDSAAIANVQPATDSVPVAKDSIPAVTDSASVAVVADSSTTLKTVLYLGGGERSPWFQLGVLYAIEEYGIPVDSVVASSWGAWIGALWARGVPLDEIQKMMRDVAVAPFVGHNLSSAENRVGYRQEDLLEWPISVSGKPSIRQRFTFSLDSTHFLERNKKMLTPDSMQVVRALAKLRLQESLYRQRPQYKIPFAVQACESGKPVLVGNAVSQVMESLPLWDNASGELCPYYAMPAEDNVNELSIIVASDPLRAPVTGSASERLLKIHASDVLASQPGVVIRAHTILDTARSAWIQAGFTSFEKHLAEFTVLNGRRSDYAKDRFAGTPWTRFELSFDSLSSETQNAVKANWNASDTGLVTLENFGYALLQNPAYDSLNLNMLPSGNVVVESSVHPVFDVAAGGFGSNALGANAYLEASVHYVDHVEIELVLAGFWGLTSYGVQPRLNISKLWNKHWSLGLGYDYLHLESLKSFKVNKHRSLHIDSEDRSDLMMNLAYIVNARQQVSAEFIFGSRSFDLDSAYYGDRAIKTYPVSPMLHYRYLKGVDDNWFANEGYALNVWGGFESIGYDDGIIDVIPIYWKVLADARYTVSPTSFTTFTVAAVGGMERYHDEGHGYGIPKPFDIAPLDVAYRLHAAATPWTTEWYHAELSSHEYAMLRFNGGLYGNYFGAWIFGAYYHDFEDSPYAELNVDKFVFEPALRFAYRSFTAYAGISRVVDSDTFEDLTHLSEYNFFVRIGNYSF